MEDALSSVGEEIPPLSRRRCFSDATVGEPTSNLVATVCETERVAIEEDELERIAEGGVGGAAVDSDDLEPL